MYLKKALNFSKKTTPLSLLMQQKYYLCVHQKTYIRFID